MTKKGIPWYVEFIAAGIYITLISSVTNYVSPEVGAIVYSLPWNFLLVLFFLLKDKVPIKKVMEFTILGGVYGLIGSVIFIAAMLYAAEYYGYKGDNTMKRDELIKVIASGFVPWFLFAILLFFQK